MLYQAFCDTSGVFDHRYQAIGLVSGKTDDLEALRTELNRINSECGIRELKFSEVTRTEGRFFRAANNAIACTISNYCNYGKIRIDVMTWDTSDSRHNVPGRSDVENLGRLYYHRYYLDLVVPRVIARAKPVAISWFERGDCFFPIASGIAMTQG